MRYDEWRGRTPLRPGFRRRPFESTTGPRDDIWPPGQVPSQRGRYSYDHHYPPMDDGSFPWAHQVEPGRSGVHSRESDEEIRWKVRRSLLEDRFLDSDRITVEVHEGVVYLEGSVADYLQVRYAWDDAWDTEGVYGVISNLEVEGDSDEA